MASTSAFDTSCARVHTIKCEPFGIMISAWVQARGRMRSLLPWIWISPSGLFLFFHLRMAPSDHLIKPGSVVVMMAASSFFSAGLLAPKSQLLILFGSRSKDRGISRYKRVMPANLKYQGNSTATLMLEMITVFCGCT